VLAVVRAVNKLKAQLQRQLGRRSETPASRFDEQLRRSRPTVLMGPRAVLPGQRWATALEVLAPGLDDLRRADEFGEFLEALFKRPADPDGKMPFDAGEAVELVREWPAGEAALAALWQRLSSVDKTGSLVRYLQRRARRAPIRPPRPGPEQLLRGRVLARGGAGAAARDRPRAVVSALADRRRAVRGGALVVGARARPQPAAGRQRDAERTPGAGLFELACELWSGLRRAADSAAGCAGRRASGSGWPSAPARADEGPPRRDDAEDADRLRDNLRLFHSHSNPKRRGGARDVPL